MKYCHTERELSAFTSYLFDHAQEISSVKQVNQALVPKFFYGRDSLIASGHFSQERW